MRRAFLPKILIQFAALEIPLRKGIESAVILGKKVKIGS
jgi:hypothetical protein